MRSGIDTGTIQAVCVGGTREGHVIVLPRGQRTVEFALLPRMTLARASLTELPDPSKMVPKRDLYHLDCLTLGVDRRWFL